MPQKLREQLRRENYLTNEIILKTELEIAKGRDANLSVDTIRSIRRRIQGSVFTPGGGDIDSGALAYTVEDTRNRYGNGSNTAGGGHVAVDSNQDESNV